MCICIAQFVVCVAAHLQVLSALERIQSGKVPRADQMQAQLERVLHTLQGALEDPSAVRFRLLIVIRY